MKCRVTTAHAATYDDPISVAAGEHLHLTGKVDNWDGHRWLWAINPAGKEGWIPSDLPKIRGAETVAAYGYSALELSVQAGEIVEAGTVNHGWVWCRSGDGREGWVPVANLDLPAS